MFAGVGPYVPQMLAGLGVTLKVAVGSFAIGLLVSILATPLRVGGPRWIRRSLTAYVAIVRGLPELLVIFVVFYGGTVFLSWIAGRYVEFQALAAGIAALSVVTAAYLMEILRAALLSIPAGQWEAARTLGLSPGRTFAHVIFPQVLQKSLPGLGNQWLIILKESALVSIVGLDELMRKSVIGAGATNNPLGFYIAAGAMYIAVTTISSALLAFGEHRLSTHTR